MKTNGFNPSKHYINYLFDDIKYSFFLNITFKDKLLFIVIEALLRWARKKFSYQCKNERRKGLKFDSIQLSLAGLRATTSASISARYPLSLNGFLGNNMIRCSFFINSFNDFSLCLFSVYCSQISKFIRTVTGGNVISDFLYFEHYCCRRSAGKTIHCLYWQWNWKIFLWIDHIWYR
jgi:hypothetical protein